MGSCVFADGLKMLSNKKYNTCTASMTNINKLEFVYDGKSDYALIDNQNSKSKTWVVFFHSFGANAEEIFTSELIHPSWKKLIEQQKFGLIAFNTYGNSWMAPFVADAIHNVLIQVKKEYKIDKLVFVGGSMGGSNVLIYSVRYPKDVQAALAMCPVTNVEQHYKELIKNPRQFSEIMLKAYNDFYGESKKERNTALSLNNVQKNYKKLTMPVLISHSADDDVISVTMSDGLAKLLYRKNDFKYFRYENGGHSFPSQKGFIDCWDYYIEKYDK